MSDNVTSLGNSNNLENIPHMLRNLAHDMEMGAERTPMTLLLVAVYSPNEVPDLFIFGDSNNTLVNVGALAVMAQRMAGGELDEIG